MENQNQQPSAAEHMEAVVLARTERVDDVARAQFYLYRQDPVSLEGEPLPEIKTDADLEADLSQLLHQYLWQLWPRYAEQQPHEQRKITLKDHIIDVYDFVPEQALGGYADIAAQVLSQFEAYFPGTFERVGALTVTDRLPASFFGNPYQYPTHGQVNRGAGLIQLTPHALSYEPYRNGQLPVNRFVATLTHELMHFHDIELVPAWNAAGYTWHQKQNKDGIHYDFPVKPKACLTDYAMHMQVEDICESGVAYLWTPDILKAKALKKYEALMHASSPGRLPFVSLERVPTDAIEWPKLPEKLTYYVDETIYFPPEASH